MEPESSSPYLQAPATCPYPEPTPSSPHNPFPLPEDPSSKLHTLYSIMCVANLWKVCDSLNTVISGISLRPELIMPKPPFCE